MWPLGALGMLAKSCCWSQASCTELGQLKGLYIASAKRWLKGNCLPARKPRRSLSISEGKNRLLWGRGVLSVASRGPGAPPCCSPPRARGTAVPGTAWAPPVKSSRFKADPLGGKSFLSLHPRNIHSSHWTHTVRSVTRSCPTLQPHGPQPTRLLCP